MSLLLVGSAMIVGLLLFIIFMMKPKPFHVNIEPMEMKVLGVNIFPAIILMFNMMPEGMRKRTVTKQVGMYTKGLSKKNLLFQNLIFNLIVNRWSQEAVLFRTWCTNEYTKS